MPKQNKMLDPIPPGEILVAEFRARRGVSQNRLSRDIDIPVSRVSEIVHGKRAITADTALRLAAYFGTSAEMWMNLQADFDLRRARAANGQRIARAIRPLEAA